MTNSTKLIGLIMTAALWAGAAVAQGPSTSDFGNDMPPDMELPLPQLNSASATPSLQRSGDEGELPAPGGYSVPQADGSYDLTNGCDCPDGGGLWNQVAPIESTGTWLQRGFWYAETDAVVYNRLWSRRDSRLAAQDSNVNNPPVVNSSLGFNPVFLDTNRLLILNAALPGEDATMRATLGNFLFRDSRNRDHSIEFTAFGGGTFEQDRVLSSAAPFGLFTPFIIDGGNRSFDNSSRQTVQYTSNLDSFEMNYHVRSRLGHDQLVMDPNGGWHRSANAGLEKDYLIGFRFVEMGEKLNWHAQDITAIGNDGSYLIRTDNDMFGLQTGGGMTYQAPRWSIGMSFKGGIYVNDALGRSQLDFTADDLNDADLRLRENQLSFIGEFGILGRYHVTPNVSLRAGYNLLLLTSQALAPNQATFITDYSYLNTTGNPFYHGVSVGAEWYW